MILVLNPIINFVIYEKLRKAFVRRSKSPGFSSVFLISLISKAIATIVTYPVLPLMTLAYVSEEKDGTMGQIARKAYEENGMGFLY